MSDLLAGERRSHHMGRCLLYGHGGICKGKIGDSHRATEITEEEKLWFKKDMHRHKVHKAHKGGMVTLGEAMRPIAEIQLTCRSYII
jgi:hypothetical protein